MSDDGWVKTNRSTVSLKPSAPLAESKRTRCALALAPPEEARSNSKCVLSPKGHAGPTRMSAARSALSVRFALTDMLRRTVRPPQEARRSNAYGVRPWRVRTRECVP